MASNTPNLNLLKKDPIVDGNDTFNIQTMLNDNWDKIDAAVGNIDIPDSSLDVKGKVQLSSAVDSDAEDMAATPKAVKSAYDVGIAAQVTANAANSAAAAAQNTANAANSAAAEAQNTANAANTAAAVAQTTANAAKSAAAAAQTTANQAFQSGNERKAQMVAALVAKGVPATTSESWDTLIGKMDTVSQGEMVSFRYIMPYVDYNLRDVSARREDDYLILAIPSGVSNLTFVTSSVYFTNDTIFSGTQLSTRTSNPNKTGGYLALGLKDHNNMFFQLWSCWDEYNSKDTGDYIYAFVLDFTKMLSSYVIKNEDADMYPGARALHSVTVPNGFDTSGEMSLIIRSSIDRNFNDPTIAITRRATVYGTLMYA